MTPGISGGKRGFSPAPANGPPSPAVVSWAAVPDLADQPVVFVMRADPEPEYAVGGINAERAMACTHTYRPVALDTLEVERWVLRIDAQELIVVARQLLEFRREFVEPLPEPL